MTVITSKQSKKRRSIKTRSKLNLTSGKPRLSVFRSHKSMFVQIIDDLKGNTLVSAHTQGLQGKEVKRIEIARALGELIAKKAKEKKISAVVFDRGSYRYHGLVKAVAEGARKGGLIL